MKLFRFLIYICWLLGMAYFACIKMIYISLSNQDLEAINYNNNIFETKFRGKDENLGRIKSVERTVRIAGQRSQEVGLVKVGGQSYSLFSKSINLLDSIGKNKSFIRKDEDEVLVLEKQLAYILDSITVDKTYQSKKTMAPDVSLNRFFNQSASFFYSGFDHETLMNTSLTIKKYYLNEVEKSITTHLMNSVGVSCISCFNKIFVYVLPSSKEVEEGRKFEADLFLSTNGCSGCCSHFTVDYGQERTVNPFQPFQFIAQSNPQYKDKPSLKKWRATIDTQDTTYTIETNYTVKPMRK